MVMDAAADGYVRGEGAMALMVRPAPPPPPTAAAHRSSSSGDSHAGGGAWGGLSALLLEGSAVNQVRRCAWVSQVRG